MSKVGFKDYSIDIDFLSKKPNNSSDLKSQIFRYFELTKTFLKFDKHEKYKTNVFNNTYDLLL